MSCRFIILSNEFKKASLLEELYKSVIKLINFTHYILLMD